MKPKNPTKGPQASPEQAAAHAPLPSKIGPALDYKTLPVLALIALTISAAWYLISRLGYAAIDLHPKLAESLGLGYMERWGLAGVLFVGVTIASGAASYVLLDWVVEPIGRQLGGYT